MQGGGLAENAIVPMNLSRGGVVDVVVTGAWSQKVVQGGAALCAARVAASNADDRHTRIPPRRPGR
jgi:phosphoserine aminotransferase